MNDWDKVFQICPFVLFVCLPIYVYVCPQTYNFVTFDLYKTQHRVLNFWPAYSLMITWWPWPWPCDPGWPLSTVIVFHKKKYIVVSVECPLGYNYTSVAVTNTHRCVKCPGGTYGIRSTYGSECQQCPDGKNPGLQGQTHSSSCNFKCMILVITCKLSFNFVSCWHV